jgi:hypothetical protein
MAEIQEKIRKIKTLIFACLPLKKEKSRFFLLCQQTEGAAAPCFINFNLTTTKGLKRAGLMAFIYV